MWGGTRRLLLLQLGSPLRTLDRALPNDTKLALASSPRVSTAEAYRQCAAVAVDQLLVEHGGPAWDADGFRALLASVRAGFATAALSSARLVGEILGAATTIEATLATMLTPAHDESVLDARDHLERLLHQGWISAAGFDRLPDLARYLRALEHRVERARTQPDRDRRHIATLQALERDYRRVSRRATAPGACGRCWRSSASAPSPSPSGPRAASASPRCGPPSRPSRDPCAPGTASGAQRTQKRKVRLAASSYGRGSALRGESCKRRRGSGPSTST